MVQKMFGSLVTGSGCIVDATEFNTRIILFAVNLYLLEHMSNN